MKENRWKVVKKSEYDEFDYDDFILFQRPQLDSVEYELRWVDRRRRVMTLSLLAEFNRYLKKLESKLIRDDEFGPLGFLDEYKEFLACEADGEKYSDAYFGKWAELITWIFPDKEPPAPRYRKFLNFIHNKNHKKCLNKRLVKSEVKKRYIYHDTTKYIITINPNTKASSIQPNDERFYEIDFELIKSFQSYLNDNAKQTKEVVNINSVIANAIFDINIIKANPFDKELHISLWKILYETIMNNTLIYKRYNDWKKKKSLRKKIKA